METKIFMAGTTLVSAVTSSFGLMSMSETRRLLSSAVISIGGETVSYITRKITKDDDGKVLTVGKKFCIMKVFGEG